MITSKENARIKELAKLKTSKYRKETKTFLVEGKHLVSEAFNLGLVIEAFSLDLKDNYTQVSEEVMKKLISTESMVSEIAVCKMLEEKPLSDKILILDKVQDPGNLGTLLRSAKAFNFNTVILGLGTVDLYNEKVIRSSQGAIFKLNIISKDLLTFIPSLKGYDIYGTNVVNGIDVETLNNPKKIAVVLGNEGNGITDEVKALLDKNIYIKLDNTESLNVSVAGGIIMYEINKKSK